MAGRGSYMPVPGGEADLGADRPGSYMSDGSILGRDGNYLGPSEGPAPSIMSRDSTYSSLQPPSLGGDDARSSWGSNRAFGQAGDLPAGAAESARPRVPSQLAQGYTSPFTDDEQGHIAPNAPVSESDKEYPAWAGGAAPKKRKNRVLLWAIIIALILICLGVGLGVGLGIAKPWESNSKSANDHSNADGTPDNTNQDNKPEDNKPTPTASTAPTETAKPTWGGQGSTITLSDGTEMIYENPFGGYWVWDEQNPLNNSARCNSWSPSLDERWDPNVHVINGVNLGGWLNTEPFIVPGLYEQTPNGPAGKSVDEYTLSANLGDNLERVMRQHYDTFITERDFAEIASAGLNYVRLPIGHWAVQKLPNEPHLEHVSWEYVLKAFQWARKYGLRINLDLHTAPGSQNGWNHSGKLGNIGWLNGTMGLANAQRTLEIIRSITEFISQPEWAPVVTMFGFLNEPRSPATGKETYGAFVAEVYDMIRGITGTGEGKGPIISMHNGFTGYFGEEWYSFMRGADRIAMDVHPYLVFQDQLGTNPETFKYRPCNAWATPANQTLVQFGMYSAGEWSVAVNDCGQWLNGVDLGARYDGTYAGWEGRGIGSCGEWEDYRLWDQARKDSLATYSAASMDALQSWFFWTWKIGNSTSSVPQPNPLWNYQLGLQQGWLPKDPRSVRGTCVRDGGVASNPFYTMAESWMTGGAGAGAAVQTGNPKWPPTTMGSDSGAANAAAMGRVPQYTATGNPVTLPGPTYTPPGAQQAFNFGSGWANPNDNRGAYVPVAGCEYPDPYVTGAIPGEAGCGAGSPRRRGLEERAAAPTPTRGRSL